MKIEFAVLYDNGHRTWDTVIVDVPLDEETTMLTEVQAWAEEELLTQRHFKDGVAVLIYNDSPEDG